MDDYKRLNYYRLSAEEVLEQLHSRSDGLVSKEARERLEQLGTNTLHRTKRDSALTDFPASIQKLAGGNAAGEHRPVVLSARL